MDKNRFEEGNSVTPGRRLPSEKRTRALVPRADHSWRTQLRRLSLVAGSAGRPRPTRLRHNPRKMAVAGAGVDEVVETAAAGRRSSRSRPANPICRSTSVGSVLQRPQHRDGKNPRVDGQLHSNVAFKEGQFVTAEGEILTEVDRRRSRFNCRRRKRRRTKAMLNGMTALLNGAQTEYARNQTLLDKGLIPKQQFDMQSACQVGTRARSPPTWPRSKQRMPRSPTPTCKSLTRKSPLRSVDASELRLVDPGNIVRAADPNGIALIAQIQPISVLFNIPEDSLTAVLKSFAQAQL